MRLSVLHGIDFTHRPNQCGCSPALNTNNANFNKLQTYAACQAKGRWEICLWNWSTFEPETLFTPQILKYDVNLIKRSKKTPNPVFLVFGVTETSAHLHKYEDCGVATTRKMSTIDLGMWNISIYLTKSKKKRKRKKKSHQKDTTDE